MLVFVVFGAKYLIDGDNMFLQDAYKKLVGIMNTRTNTAANEKRWLGGSKMAQARVLTEKELKLLFAYIATRKYAARDRCMVAMSFYGGMRIGEIVSAKVRDVLAADGTIRHEIRLAAEQTKGKRGRTVTLSEKLRKELLSYLQARFNTKQLAEVSSTTAADKALFGTQKEPDRGFTPNTGAYHFHMLYREAGLDGASSHSGRRTFATTLSGKGTALRTLMELMGHRQAQTTMRYCDVTADMKKAAVELI